MQRRCWTVASALGVVMLSWAVGLYDFRDAENTDRVTELDNKNGMSCKTRNIGNLPNVLVSPKLSSALCFTEGWAAPTPAHVTASLSCELITLPSVFLC